MKNTLHIAPASVTAHLEEMRHMLQTVLQDMTGTEVAFDDLDSLIGELVRHGVTCHEIGFLISESLPAVASP